MLYPFLENTSEKIRYTLIWVLYAILQTFVLYPIVALPLWILMLDGVVHALILGLLGILLWSTVRYGNYAVLSIYQRLINHVTLAVLIIAIWLGSGYGLFYGFWGEKVASAFVPVLPLRALIGLLIYLLIIKHFREMSQQLDTENEISAETLPVIEETKPQKSTEPELLERIAVKSGTKIHVVLIPDIIYLQADGDYVQIFTSQGKYLKEQTMKYFEEHLPENQFVRVHRSVIVNVEMISRIELYEKQNQLLTLKTGQQIKTSLAGYKALRGVLNL